VTPEIDRRLAASPEDLREHTKALLARVKLAPGASALDLGCGQGGVIDLLSELVGESGRVVGLDLDHACVASARAQVQQRGLSNVEVLQADASDTGLPSAAFDLAHMRALLVDTIAPGLVIVEIARLVKPGGWIAILEPDGELDVHHPPHLDRYAARRLPHLLAAAGMEKIVVEARAPLRGPVDRPRDGLGISWLPLGYFLAWARQPAFRA
jgi:ubiquinone/menaquinone biosynthesis C-methylase UbiE